MTAYPSNSPADRIHRSIERDDLFAASLKEQDQELARIEEMSSAEISSELTKLGLSSRPGIKETKAMLGLISAEDLDDDKDVSIQNRKSFWKNIRTHLVDALSSNFSNSLNAGLVAGSVACLAITFVGRKDSERAEEMLRMYKEQASIAENLVKSVERNNATSEGNIVGLKQQLADISTRFTGLSDVARENSKAIRDDAKFYSASLNRIEANVATLVKASGVKTDPAPLVNMEWIDIERYFKENVIQTSNYEIQSSQIALSKTRAIELRAYAQEIIRDFRAINVALIGLERGYPTVPSTASLVFGNVVGAGVAAGVSTTANTGVETTGTSVAVPLTAEQQESLVKLSVAKAGIAFDQMYIDQQAKSLQDLEEVIRKFGQEKSNSALSNFSQQLMPSVQYSSQKVQTLKAKFVR